MITDNYGRNCNTDTRKTEELFAIFLTNPARYVSGWKLSILTRLMASSLTPTSSGARNPPR
jgi:hypothetical protein